ncbi:MAG: hypothetical protein WC761_07050 [Candidatus Paceibacterota bacterium]|jgi:hypothetical protein
MDTTAIVESTSAPVTAPKTVKERVNEFFKEDPIMIKVAWCESRFRQFDKDGSVFRGKVNPKDVGVMQVNTYYHAKTADKLGYDLMTLEGNLAYAKHLYEREGTTPWMSSSPCWMTSKSEVAILK